MYNISFSYEQTGALPRALECAREALRSWRVSRPPGHKNIKNAEKRVLKLERASLLRSRWPLYAATTVGVALVAAFMSSRMRRK